MLVPPASPPYALSPTTFRFAALAALAGRAPLGGQREIALAVYLAARLVHDTLPDRGVSQTARAERAASAKSWLANLALPTNLRPVLLRLIEASSGHSAAAAQPVRALAATAAGFLDQAAVAELDQLAGSLAAQPIVG